jgi:hypothetical protein
VVGSHNTGSSSSSGSRYSGTGIIITSAAAAAAAAAAVQVLLLWHKHQLSTTIGPDEAWPPQSSMISPENLLNI